MGYFESLQERLAQSMETVSRTSRIDIVSGGVDEIDPPEDLDEYAEQARTTAIVRSNMRKYVNDVWEPGYRMDGPDETVQFFTGEQEERDGQPPEVAPEGGFLSQAAVFSGERRQEWLDFAKEATWQRWVRGTVLVELLKAERTDPESPISGFYFVRPETVYPQVENNTDILLPPDVEELPEDISRSDVDLTPREEVAAYIQFDDESIVGLRRQGGMDEAEVPLSQNDVRKATLEPGIGLDIADVSSDTDTVESRTLTEASSVFGTSVIAAISEDIAEYKQIKRDRAEAISRKAYGLWTAQFTPETLELGNRTEVREWTDESIRSTESELNSMGPGDVLTSDAGIDLERHDGNVPDLNPTLEHYVDNILSALPVPKALTGFADNINRDVVGDQREAYEDLLSEERQFWEGFWTETFRTVASRYDLPTEGLQLKIEPPTEDNPVKSMDTEAIERMNTYMNALTVAAGPQLGPSSLVDREALLDVLEFPTDADGREAAAQAVYEEADAETREAWEDVMDVEVDALATQFSEGDPVQTPQGMGVVSGVFTEGFDDVEASESSPTYAVALKDARVGSEFYSASQLREAELPEGGPEDPTDDVEAMANIMDATETEYEALDFTPPESWRDSDLPARTIALKAWAGMNGQFDCGGSCCKGEMAPKLGDRGSDEFCASFKDYVLGTEEWRGWGSDEALAGDTGNGQRGPFTTVPVLPSDLQTLTKPWLVRWAEWVKAGRPAITGASALREWNPALHPRDPETGKFVERPFDIPDGVDVSGLPDSSPAALLQEIDAGGGDVDSILSSDTISVDGVPDSVNSVAELSDAAEGTVVDTEIGDGFDDQERQSIQEGLNGYADSLKVEAAREALANGLVSVEEGRAASVSVADGAEMTLTSGDESVLQHEAAHATAQILGVSQGAYSERGEDGWPAHEFGDETKVVEKANALRGDDGVVGFDDWFDDVETNTPDLSASQFESLTDTETTAARLIDEATEGTLLRTSEFIREENRRGFTEPDGVVFEVVDKETVTNPETGEAVRADLTLADATGDTIELSAFNPSGSPARIEYGDAATPFSPEPEGIQTEPDGDFQFADRFPDADDVLGETDLDGEEALNNHYAKVNRAWYRQATAGREYTTEEARATTIGSGVYSAQKAGETLARMNEALAPQELEQETSAAAKALVNYHPDLLESLRHVRELPDGFKSQLNEELAANNAEFRFEVGE